MCLNDKVRMRGELKYSVVTEGPMGKLHIMGKGLLATGRAGKLEPGAISRCLKLISSVVHIWSVIMITRNSGVV